MCTKTFKSSHHSQRLGSQIFVLGEVVYWIFCVDTGTWRLKEIWGRGPGVQNQSCSLKPYMFGIRDNFGQILKRKEVPNDIADILEKKIGLGITKGKICPFFPLGDTERSGRKKNWLWNWTNMDSNISLSSFTECVTLGKSFNFFKHQFSCTWGWLYVHTSCVFTEELCSKGPLT